MKFAFCNELFKKWKVDRMCDFLVKLGYQGIELAPWVYSISPKDFSKIDKISTVIHKSGLDIVGIHNIFWGKSNYSMNHPDKSIRKKTSAYVCDLVTLCSDLGGKVIIMGNPQHRIVQEGTTYEEAWANMKDFFRKPLDIAREKQITFCLEPLSNDQTNFINTAQEAIAFIKEVDHPNLALMLDGYSLSKEDRKNEDIILHTEGYLKYFHADDANKKGPGAGKTDFIPIFRSLKHINYQGYVSVEIHDLTVDPEVTASRSIQYMMKCLDFINSQG